MVKEKLKIAVFGTASLPIPPFQGYGGTQRGVYDFLKNMNAKGHRLHLFGPGDSDISALENVVLHSTVEQSLWIPENALSPEEKAAAAERHFEESIAALERTDREEGIDVINVRFDNVRVLRELVETFGKDRIVYGLHNIRNRERIEAISELGVQCVAHCRNHRSQYKHLPNIRVITYGIDVPSFPYSEHTLTSTSEEPTLEVLRRLKERGQDYLINLGGIGKHKGQRTCIRLAMETGNVLIIAGEPQDRTGSEKSTYFAREVEPNIDGDSIIHFGNADEEQKKELLRHARGFLFPSGFEDITWNEPFGRAPVEALSCGTPVIAHRKGSMPEVIFDGFNGYLFDNVPEAVKQIGALSDIARSDCRRVAEVKFDSRRVANEYEQLFYEMVAA